MEDQGTEARLIQNAYRRLSNAKALQEEYKCINRASHRKDALQALAALGYQTEKAAALAGRGLPAVLLIENRAEIRRLRAEVQRLERLETLRHMPITEEHYGALIVRQRPDLDRVQLVFPHKPSAEVIGQLKRAGFVYSHKNGAWQRRLTEVSVQHARMLGQQAQ